MLIESTGISKQLFFVPIQCEKNHWNVNLINRNKYTNIFFTTKTYFIFIYLGQKRCIFHNND